MIVLLLAEDHLLNRYKEVTVDWGLPLMSLSFLQEDNIALSYVRITVILNRMGDNGRPLPI